LYVDTLKIIIRSPPANIVVWSDLFPEFAYLKSIMPWIIINIDSALAYELVL
jgi:hypothetical protein